MRICFRQEFNEIIKKMKDMYGIEGNHFRLYRVPLLLNGENCVLPCLDSSAIHIKKLVELAQN